MSQPQQPTQPQQPQQPEQPQQSPAFTWSREEIRRVGHRVAELVADHLVALPAQPVFDPVSPELAAAFRGAPLPVHGQSVDTLLDDFARDIAPHPFGNGHPRFYGWVNSPPAVIGVFAEALAAAMNPSVAGGNHAAVHVERQVTGWLARLLGFPPDSMGLLVSGTSSAAIVALTVARHSACKRLGWDVRAAGLQGAATDAPPPRLVVYRSAESHGCHQKAIELLGIGSANIRIVPTDAALRMMPAALDRLLATDVAAGLVPVAVIASVGTVNSGAIDPLDAIADICARHGVWLHVDGAYGAPAALLPGMSATLAALARADSVAMDPHKWLYVPVDAALVVVRDASLMRDAFSLVPPYLRTDGDEHGVQGPPWLSEYGIEQTRPFRALKVWMALRYFGVEGYRALIAHDVALAQRLAARVRARRDFELWEPQGLSIVCFRARPESLRADPAATDALNRAVLQRVQLGGEAFLSSTVMDGRFWLRACIVNARAAPADIDAVTDVVAAAVERELARASGSGAAETR